METRRVVCATYCRVSTSNHGQSNEMQLLELRKYCAARQWTIFKEYCDSGVSGAKESRPALNQLMDDARKRKFDAVLIFRYDRMARSVSHLIRVLTEFQSLGIQFVSFSENLDTESSMGKAMFTVMAAFSELERSVIRERVQTRVTQLIASGKQWGRPKAIWRRDLALAELSAGASLRATAKKYGVSHTQLARERDCAKQGTQSG